MKHLNLTFFLIVMLLSGANLRSFAQGTDFTIGTGTSVNASTSYPTPYGDWYEGDKAQFLYKASELLAAGMGPGFIYAVKFNVTATNGANDPGFTISIGTTSVTALSGWQNSAMTQIYTAPGNPPAYTPSLGLNTYTLSTPMFWNGVDNILIQTCHGYGAVTCRTPSYTYNASVAYTNLTYNGCYYYSTDCNGSLCGFTGTGTATTSRPNIIFRWGSSGMNNASLASVAQPSGKFCPGTYSLQVLVKNNGRNQINNVQVNWVLDGIPQTPVNYNNLIDTFGGAGGNSAVVTLGNVSFAGSPHTLVAFTALPNNKADTVNNDDTLKTSLSPSPVSFVTPNGPTIFCTAGLINVTLSAPPGIGSVYQWKLNGSPIPGAIGQNYTATAAGDYSVQVDSNFCSNTSSTIRVDNLAMPMPYVTPEGFPVLCDGDSMTLVANAGVTGAAYQWKFQGNPIPGANASNYVVHNAGNYTVVTSKLVCNATSAGVTVVPKPAPTPDIKDTVANGVAILSTDASYVSYQWYISTTANPTPVPLPGDTLFVCIPKQAGDYSVTVSNGGCKASSPVYSFTPTTGIHNLNASNISIYPNPANTTIHVNAPEGSTLIITSVDGKELIKQKTSKNDINISSFPNGIYLIKIMNSDNSLTYIDKLIKQ